MKPFDWDEEKNKWLKEEREVSFEQVVFSIENGKLLDIIKHPNRAKYKNQRIYVIEIEGYAYMVPYVEDDEIIFLKTIFPSRKYTKMYLKKGEK
ncbi:MAG: toxin [Desulfobacterales bacterium]|nr:toxin [Desulfobacterales bacterium]